MQAAAAHLTGRHDFAAFRASDCERRTTVRVVRRLELERQGALLMVEVEATAFLKNMVRIIVGTLIDIGRGRIPEDAPARMLFGHGKCNRNGISVASRYALPGHRGARPRRARAPTGQREAAGLHAMTARIGSP